jgi:hypothetical protein
MPNAMMSIFVAFLFVLAGATFIDPSRKHLLLRRWSISTPAIIA